MSLARCRSSKHSCRRFERLLADEEAMLARAQASAKGESPWNAPPGKVSPLSDQTLDGKLLPSVAFSDHDFKFAILFDPSTKLPAAVRSFDDDCFLGRFLDSDAVNFPASAPGLKLIELSPNVQFATGGSHNSLVISRKDHLVIIDAPINEWQSRWTIDAAKAKYPGKPIKYLVLTHHHNDHTGGARTYVAEGATVIVAAPNKQHFERLFQSQHKFVPDELQKNPKPANIIEFADHMKLKDDSGDIELYKVANPHSEVLTAYLAAEKSVWVTALYSPVRDKDRSEMFVSFYEALKQRGIAPTRIAGGHGGVVPASDMEAIMAAK
jgi:glyoxylase-like metal-dependent hydrolase (beta-lactamase superfamily II)